MARLGDEKVKLLRVKFWGCNGSIASPCDSEQIEAKIKRVLQLIKPDNIADEKAIDNFLGSLPHGLKGTYKGNTSCVQVTTDSGVNVVFDSGTGIRKMAAELMASPLGKGQGELHIFYSHLHWDHIQGFPFFVPAYIPGNKIHIYGVIEDLKEKFRRQMMHPYFPVPFDGLGADIEFHELSEGQEVTINKTVKVNSEKLYHPQVSHAYSVEEFGKKAVYMTDSEFHMTNMQLIQNAVNLCKNADLFVFDCQFTFQDAISKIDWGHSSVFTGIDIATSANAKSLYLFHHEPAYDDFKIEKIIDEAIKYQTAAGNPDLVVKGAYDGLSVNL